MPHVLTLTDSLGPGGAEQLLIALNLSLDPARFRRTVCVTRADPPDETRHRRTAIDRLRAGGVEVLELDRQSRASVAPWRHLVRFLRSERVDIVHAHKFGSNVWGVLLGRTARVPVVVAHEHTWSYEGQPARRLLDRVLIGRGADAFVAVSREDARRMREIESVPPGVIRLIPNGIPDLPVGDGAKVRRELGLAPEAPVIGTVATLRPQKAHDVLLEACAILAREHAGVQVLLAGAGDARRLRALAHDLGVESAIRFLGPRLDVPDVIHALDVAVSPSDFEGSPLAVMEYMAAGRAIVATAVGGVPDLIDDGVHGVLVPHRDPAALAAAIAALLADPDRRRRLGAAARERQRREFTLEAMTHRFEALYEELLAARRR